jgi:hypothetical protein
MTPDLNEMIKIVLVLVGLWFWLRAGRFTFVGAFFFGVFYAFLLLTGPVLYRF